MQPSAAGGSSSSGGSGGGGGELGRSGLARFRSAPATWLEALLEEEEEDPLKPNQCLTQLLSSGGVGVGVSGGGGGGGGGDPNLSQFEQANFQRQNSSPADLFDGYFSNFGIPSSYDYLSPTIDVSQSSKRTREDDSQHQQPSPKFPSLPKVEQVSLMPSRASSLTEMDMEKILEDSVPCRVRAKRGCATHPRSIAERVRRTRISDRIRKLQELVPNMDKQTNTADMLEEAVEYVKYLQKQIEELSEQQRNCKCAAKD